MVPAGCGGLEGAHPGSDAIPIHASRSGLRPPLVAGAAAEEGDGESVEPGEIQAGSTGHDDACRSLHLFIYCAPLCFA